MHESREGGPFLITYEGRRFAYIEVYRPLHSNIAAFQPWSRHDLGFHLAIVDRALIGHGLGTAFVSDLVRTAVPVLARGGTRRRRARRAQSGLPQGDGAGLDVLGENGAVAPQGGHPPRLPPVAGAARARAAGRRGTSRRAAGGTAPGRLKSIGPLCGARRGVPAGPAERESRPTT
ncbi:GNAT family N-acetyltransferase [Streptomyces sp. CA-278952]|nr:GNAT family N-acetyltransferase [Streptomyces sp. CA-278952]UZI33806.1 acetyltransferase [Streptomyces sp. VB1]WDG33670.1 GNAT family N-acetyltransferase [Streptomyces sp. CA-278952]